jgi:transposase
MDKDEERYSDQPMSSSPKGERHGGCTWSSALRGHRRQQSDVDVWILPEEAGFVVANTPAGFATLIARLEDHGPVLIVLEATGAYHRQVTMALDAVGFNPSWLHYFARWRSSGNSRAQRKVTGPTAK